MSHNKIKVAGKSPNQAGEISVDVGDLNDVTVSSASTSQFLQYNGIAWVNTTASVGGAGEFILFGQGSSVDYSDSPAVNFSVGSTIYAHDPSPINNISGSSLSVTSGYTGAETDKNNWLNSITLPSGNYLLTASVGIEFSASGYLSFMFHDGSQHASHIASIGESVTSFDGGSGFIQSFLELSSQTTLNLEIYNQSNVDSVANQGTTVSTVTQIMILKVG
jgi:hypothetical protein